jgi:hypothetical protein
VKLGIQRSLIFAWCSPPGIRQATTEPSPQEAGLTHIDAVLEHGELANYYLEHRLANNGGPAL